MKNTATNRYMTIGFILLRSLALYIPVMIDLNIIIDSPEVAVPIVNLDTFFFPK